MQEASHVVNQQTNNILHLPQPDMMTQLGSMNFFGFFSTCLPVLKCIEECSTTKEPELQEYLVRGMQAFSNIITNVENDKDDWPDLEELLDETKPAMLQVERIAPESESPKKYIAGQQHLYKIERISSDPFQILASTSSSSTPENLTPMRWTPQLHDQFVEAIDQLSGSRTEGFETKDSQAEDTPSLRVAINGSADIDINEALKIQMEVQKQLHEHLEMQRELQMRLREQGKHLQKMIEQQKHAAADQSQASSLSPLPSNGYDDCIKERANKSRDYDKHDTKLQN